MSFVLLAEPSAPVAGVLRRYLEGAGHEVSWVGTLDDALRAARERPPAVVLASGAGPLDGEALCRGLKAQGASPPVLLVYPPDEEQADLRAADAGADGCLVGPLKRPNVLTCVSLLVQREQARGLASGMAPVAPGAAPGVPAVGGALAASSMAPAAPVLARPSGSFPPVPSRASGFAITPVPGTLTVVEPEGGRRPSRPDLPAAGASSPDFEFLKRLMLMEVKRSRRYRYPIAVLLVELDGFAERSASVAPAARTAVLAEALGLLVAGVRDIDVAVPFADSRFVVFLPHTPRSGALVVAERLRERISGLKGLPGTSASVGVAVSEPPGGKGAPSASQAQVSFGSLLKEAGEALRRAQAAGGNRVEPAAGGRPQPA
ncbi:diguanylate cyclase [Pyxidicoccus fallax]|uniref:Diguanylate cyclase n=1 Tax=Pyxidicoccus fallax TaxID=394095 RepID=A0A848L443_9BACT|nr:diguanylate cyclase [Pyxidicoccus fallax]NMO13730.1 diguanylate cyclase [Pyxidicoccus fallax]NPC81852.1 diguanylate cyclase [Pyxidicoccus fallax]